MSIDKTIAIAITSKAGTEKKTVAIENAVIGGWTARNVAAMEHHMKELEAIGVPRPKTTPIYYRVGATRINTATDVQAVGGDSSGEVEFVLLKTGGRLLVGLGSDHTDRKAEVYGITVAKQMCDKPVAPEFWPFAEVEDHWDQLILRSYIANAGREELYQEGPVATMLHPRDLMEKYVGPGKELAEGTLMFGGTLAARGGVRPAERFTFEIEDPVLKRKIRHSYAIHILPILG